MKKKVAIACQGGGSHSAFTAGVLRGILSAKANGEDFDIVGISGTSGGAICALLAWYGLVNKNVIWAIENLKSLWTKTRPVGNAVTNLPTTPLEFYDYWVNHWMTSASRPKVPAAFPLAPSVHFNPYWADALAAWLMPPLDDALTSFADGRRALRELIEGYVSDERIRAACDKDGHSPELLIGAVDVCTGEFQCFRSRLGSRSGFGIDAIVASVALPRIMKAVNVVHNSGFASENASRRGSFWDGLFSQNPPLRELPELLSKDDDSKEIEREIWIIKNNPASRDLVPRNLEDILDRRNELSGNLSLEQEKYFIEKINQLIGTGRLVNPDQDGAASDRNGSNGTQHYHEVELKTVELPSRELEKRGIRLDAASKAERRRPFLQALMSEGERLARKFTKVPTVCPEEVALTGAECDEPFSGLASRFSAWPLHLP